MNPRARTHKLLIDADTVVYDTDSDHAHSLDPQASQIFAACDGHRTPEQIAEHTGLGLGAVTHTISELATLGLLDHEPALTRRHALGTLAKLGAAAAAFPIVHTIVAPTPAQASSCIPSGGVCSTSSECCNGLCNNGTCV